jgi:hypothetical protein
VLSASAVTEGSYLLQDETGSVAILQYSPSSHPLKHSFVELRNDKGLLLLASNLNFKGIVIPNLSVAEDVVNLEFKNLYLFLSFSENSQLVQLNTKTYQIQQKVLVPNAFQ